MKTKSIKRQYSREYNSWKSMMGRCFNPALTHVYHRYGGRGISVCSEWRSSFAKFLSDMGPRPAETTLNRIDNDGDYTPENCEWADCLRQAQNRSDNIRVTIAGQSKAITGWCRIFGTSPMIAYGRIARGWNTIDAIMIDNTRSKEREYEHRENRRRKERILTISGVSMTLGEWAKKSGLTPKCVHSRLTHGWSLERALTFPLVRRPERKERP